MAKLTKAKARKRLKECLGKINKIGAAGYFSGSMKDWETFDRLIAKHIRKLK